MTDYLTRLAKRTLGLLPVAQPLITPSFSSFTVKKYVRPEISINENGAVFYQQVIPGAQEKKASLAFSKPLSKMQKKPQSRNELSSGKAENFVAGDQGNSLLPHKKTGADYQGQIYPEPDFDHPGSKPQSVHIENELPSKDTGIVSDEKYPEKESFTLLDQTPKHLKNSWNRINPGNKMRDIDIPDPISVSKSLAGPFPEKYGEGLLLPDLISDFKMGSPQSFDILSENQTNRKSNLIRQSSLNNKPALKSSGQKLNPDHIRTSDILHEPEKLSASDTSPGRVAWPAEKDRSIVKKPENYEMKRKTGFKNVIYPVIKISPEGKEHIIRDIHTKIEPQIPTIKVTIGRVEVRAVPPPPVLSPSPSMKKPALSLDEYLKQHNG